MIINSIGAMNANRYVNKNTTTKAANVQTQPSFKRQNYMAMFDEVFTKDFRGWDQLARYANKLLAAAKFEGTKGIPFFNNFIAKEDSVFNNLFYLCMKGTKSSYDQFRNTLQKGKSYPLLVDITGKPIIEVVNNGPYDEMYHFNIKNLGKECNVKFIFNDLGPGKNNRHIDFSKEYKSSDFRILRGTQKHWALIEEVFYGERPGRIKSRAVLDPHRNMLIEKKYNPDGSEYGILDTLFDDLDAGVRDFLNGKSSRDFCDF